MCFYFIAPDLPNSLKADPKKKKAIKDLFFYFTAPCLQIWLEKKLRTKRLKDLPNILGKIPEITLFYWVMQFFFRVSLKMCDMFISTVLKDILQAWLLVFDDVFRKNNALPSKKRKFPEFYPKCLEGLLRWS